MKKLSRYTFLTILIWMCAVAGLAQDSKLEVPARRHFKHNTKIQTKYDRANDQTMVYIDPYFNYSGSVKYFRLLENVTPIAAFRYPGKTLTAIPQQVEFGLITNSSNGWFFGKDTELIVVADGKPVFSGTMKIISKNKPSVYVEILNIVMPTEIFLKIANSNSVEIKAGPLVQVKLLNDHLEVFRDLASHMKT